MKKVILFLVAALCAGVLCSCNSCKKQEKKEAVKEGLVWERTASLDKEYMFNNYGGDYRWFESCILLKDYLDEENDGTITGISNVFQVVNEAGKSADVFVVLATHTPDTVAYEVKQGFWVEDMDMSKEIIKLSFEEAYNKMMAANMPKPHSKNCVLRKQVGPKDANPQYIFGNIQSQIYVDAITGDVTDKNPAFPNE